MQNYTMQKCKKISQITTNTNYCSERTLNSNADECSIMARFFHSASLGLVVTRIYVRSLRRKNLEFFG